MDHHRVFRPTLRYMQRHFPPSSHRPSYTFTRPLAMSTDPSPESKFMKEALDEACRGVALGEGGPFGAVITRDNIVISRGHNRVLQTNDPTAHAEVVAIRDACASLGRFSLHDCVLHTTCLPCPMCFAAVHWAKIPRVVYSAEAADAAAVGFDDQFLYDAIRGDTDEKKCHFDHQPHDESHRPFVLYTKMLAENRSSRY